MTEVAEVLHTIERLQSQFEELALRGLRTAGANQVAGLEALGEEFDRIGAAHLAGRIADLVRDLRSDDRGAAAALLRAQSSLGIMERILTLETVAAMLDALAVGEETSEEEA